MTRASSHLGSPTEEVPELENALVEEMMEDPGGMPVTTGTYVLSVVGRTRRRTLHQGGACYRIPGVHYKEFLVVGDSRPSLEAGERLCTSCFGKQQKAFAEAEASDVQSVSASSMSSSTSVGSTDSGGD